MELKKIKQIDPKHSPSVDLFGELEQKVDLVLFSIAFDQSPHDFVQPVAAFSTRSALNTIISN